MATASNDGVAADRHECPMCANKSITKHCANVGCKWVSCQNTACLATMDNPKGIGHYLDPDRGLDRDKTVRRLRLIHTQGGWQHRDIA